MEDQCSPLSWAFYYQEEGVRHEEYLKHSLLYTTLELETTILSTREELARKDDELVHLKILLTKTAKERDEAIAKCQRLNLEKLLLMQHKVQHIEAAVSAPPPIISLSGTATSNEDQEPLRRPHHDSSSDCDETSPGKEYFATQQQLLTSAQANLEEMMDQRIVPKKPLPEKGKFLQAVMEAGPLLQTLLLAGPLPQWQHPPPQLSSIDIPPVTISSQSPRLLHQDSCLSTTTGINGTDCFSKKRALMNSDQIQLMGSDNYSSPNSSKYQKVVHQSPLTNI